MCILGLLMLFWKLVNWPQLWSTRSGSVSLFQKICVCFVYIRQQGKNTCNVFPRITKSEVKFAQLCPTLCKPLNYTVHGILQARILEWVAFLFSRGSSQPRDRTQVFCIADRFFTNWAIREAIGLQKARHYREMMPVYSLLFY